MSVNKVILVGNVGADAELKQKKGSTSVTTFNVATNETYKNKSGDTVKETEWHKVVTFGKLSEICAKYVKKGSSVFVEGRIRTHSYSDKEGTTRYSTEIIANNVQFLNRTPKHSIDNNHQPTIENDNSKITDKSESEDNELDF